METVSVISSIRFIRNGFVSMDLYQELLSQKIVKNCIRIHDSAANKLAKIRSSASPSLLTAASIGPAGGPTAGPSTTLPVPTSRRP